jgi:hypothetical protein
MFTFVATKWGTAADAAVAKALVLTNGAWNALMLFKSIALATPTRGPICAPPKLTPLVNPLNRLCKKHLRCDKR